MCIVAIAWQCFNHSNLQIPADASQQRADISIPLVLLNNRDEFFARPTAPIHLWENAPILAGKDLTSGGTWLGVNPKNKRWAVVLNVREAGSYAGKKPSKPISRGQLVTDFLSANSTANAHMSPMQFAKSIDLQSYEGFNFICGDLTQAVIVSNRGQAPQALANGLYVFSNGDMQGKWQKVKRLRMKARQEILPLVQAYLQNQPQTLFYDEKQTVQHHHTTSYDLADWQKTAFHCLADTQQAEDNELPSTGVPEVIETKLSSIFIPEFSIMAQAQQVPINASSYGTRVSSLLMLATGLPNTFITSQDNALQNLHDSNLTENSTLYEFVSF